MTTKPKAVFFDLDETLVENKLPIRELFARMYHDFEDQLGAENQERFFAALKTNAAGLWESMFGTQISPEQQFITCFEQSILAAQTPLTDTSAGTSTSTATNSSNNASKKLSQDMFDHYLALSSNNVVFHDGALETLAELSRRGVTTGLITNGIEQVQLGKIHRLGLQDKVDHVTVSAQARAHKPHQPVFDLALSRAKVDANQAWQIGDHATNDVAGAIRSGMSGVFYNPRRLDVSEAFAELNEQPTFVIEHLTQVLDTIDD